MRRHIKAWIEMKRIEDGGRPGGPFTPGYCPFLRVGPGGELLPVRVTDIDVAAKAGWVYPGEAAIVLFELPYPDYPGYDALIEGGSFEILEGPRVIGTGEVFHGPSDTGIGSCEV